AQHGVRASRACRESGAQEFPELIEGAFSSVALDIPVEVLDVNLATDALAQEGDVGADHRTQVDQLGRRSREDHREKLRERLARVDGLAVDGRGWTRPGDDGPVPILGSSKRPAEPGDEPRELAVVLTNAQHRRLRRARSRW